jgi:peptidoglycan/xylan/chitin deacetylase (PgdA/CDA1 family)
LYHHVAEHESSLVDRLGVTTTPDAFEAHIRRLARDYDVVSLDDLLSGRLPRRALLITFDDGYRSVVEMALPLLQRLGLPSVFFVTGVCLERDAVPLDNLLSHLCGTVGLARLGAAIDSQGRSPMTFAQLLLLVAALPYQRRTRLPVDLAARFGIDPARLRAESGLFVDRQELPQAAAFGCEIGNHTRSHMFSRAIADEASARHELVDFARELESAMGAPVRAFSYPYGNRRDATPHVERALRASGHQAFFLAESRPHVPNGASWLWNRVCMDGCPPWRVRPALELLPPLRAQRDRLRKAGSIA